MCIRDRGVPFSILGPDETVAPDSVPMRAVAITVPDELALGGMIVAGQTVDVFVTAVINISDPTGKYIADRSTKITYQNVLILAREDAFYIIRASLPVAEEIAHLQAVGSATFSMALRPDVDVRPVDTSKLGETTTKIIEKYGLPIPQTYPSGHGPAPTLAPTPSPSPSPTSSVPPSPSPSP